MTHLKKHLESLRKQEITHFRNLLVEEESRYSHPYLSDKSLEFNRRIYWASMVEFDTDYSSDKMEKAVTKLFQEQSILRTKYTLKGTDYQWTQYSMPENIAIPTLDFSQEDEALKQRFLLSALPLYFQKQDGFADFVFRQLVLKVSSEKFLYIYAISECIHDQNSEDIIRHSIERFYRRTTPPKEIPAYDDYLEKIAPSSGYPSIDSEELTSYQLKNYYRAVRHLSSALQEAKGMCLFNIEIPYSEQKILDKWTFASSLLVAWCREFVPVSTVPVAIVHDCRPYFNYQFANSVGDFNDVIPFLLLVNQSKNVGMEMKRVLDNANKQSIWLSKCLLPRTLNDNTHDHEDPLFHAVVVFRFNAHYDKLKSDELINPINYLEKDQMPAYLPIYGLGFYFYINIENGQINIDGRMPRKISKKKVLQFLERQVKELLEL
jgi:hypothetical protein